ncbi:rRNA N6-adenosine-methyltransferase ZCCHC4-like [Oppia nitens]|uniref:rRNA N6-adenosine-methyltransferase ZCCHC4-like n=1 Tax=Oppia nitens TaxID=1686743 RepID=UPI0023DB01FA|nr:rRNA N6-adenosine-methyltransferase ZCCHC4-like [Oppia nitens]
MKPKSSTSVGRIRLIDTDLLVNPECIHGPTLLFEDIDNKNKRFYSCSSCRTRKDCPFYLTAQEWQTIQCKKQLKIKFQRQLQQTKNEINLKYSYDKNLMKLSSNGLKFCRNCSLIIGTEDVLSDHKTHYIVSDITEQQLKSPTKLMTSLTDNKFCAQYLFADQTIKFIVNDIIVKNKFTSVICIGCPTIHEHLTSGRIDNIKSILLDIDDRYKQFYSPKKFLKFNLFNNYFFNGTRDETTFMRFIEKSTKESIVIIVDPPFGGLIEAMAKTLRKFSDIWRKYHSIADENETLPIMLIFPYFNEKRITDKIPGLLMSDYLVDYQNHNKFNDTNSGRKFGSPVRIFTNISLKLIELPKADGYYYCDYCCKYVSKNNKHCFQCNDCTARDGKPYKHCNVCKRCVKNTWNHCKLCSHCHLMQEICKRKSTDSNFSSLCKRIRDK